MKRNLITTFIDVELEIKDLEFKLLMIESEIDDLDYKIAKEKNKSLIRIYNSLIDEKVTYYHNLENYIKSIKE